MSLSAVVCVSAVINVTESPSLLHISGACLNYSAVWTFIGDSCDHGVYPPWRNQSVSKISMYLRTGTFISSSVALATATTSVVARNLRLTAGALLCASSAMIFWAF
jgi:hypothetical protein